MINQSVIPRHIAIVMDGNGRWAQQRRRPRLYGHHRGAEAVRSTVKTCGKLSVDCLTLFAFSRTVPQQSISTPIETAKPADRRVVSLQYDQ